MMRGPIHFYLAQSRLGIQHHAWRSKSKNIGVEDAPEHIVTPEFLQLFPKNSSLHRLKFPRPEDTPTTRYHEVIVRYTRKLSALIEKTIQPGEMQVVIGGDHSVALGSIMAVLKRKKPASVGYIQIDSHVDLLHHKTSVTKNFHGMFGRVLLDTFDIRIIDGLVKNKLPAMNVLYVGNLELDDEEKNYLNTQAIPTINRYDIKHNAKSVHAIIADFVQRYSHIHVSFDIDVFDRSIAPATGTPSLSGLYPEEIIPILQLLRRAKEISMDLVEVNPRKRGGKKTVMLAQHMLANLLI